MTSKVIQAAQSASDSHTTGHALSGALVSFSWWAKVQEFIPSSVADVGILLGVVLSVVLIYKHLLEANKTRIETKLRKLEIKEKRLKIKELENA